MQLFARHEWTPHGKGMPMYVQSPFRVNDEDEQTVTPSSS